MIYRVLGQTTSGTLYIAPDETIVSLLAICNRDTSDSTYTVEINGTPIARDVYVRANTTVYMNLGLTLSLNDYISVSGTNLSFSVFGGEIVDWTPAELFSSDGGWYSFSDLLTLKQSSAGTGAVDFGDPVGFVRDKSGNFNHITQNTSASRPILQRTSSGDVVISYDGIDDALSVDFGDLGSDCTVAYSTESEVRLLEGQTISTAYTLPEIDINSLVVVDRALTRDEKVRLITYLASNMSGVTYGASLTDMDLICVSAVDVFVYDTSKDSDGGAWRTGDLARASSWYNEQLNTATRGSRREFPSVAVIVAETDQVVIYDGDDPDLPMWMVQDFSGISSVSALNSKVAVGTSTKLAVLDYLGDDFSIEYTTSTTPAIINNAINDVAMTVLPGAPVTNGIAVPTIAVATGGGLSVITDSDIVYDATPNGHAWWSVAFTEDTKIIGTRFANGRAYNVSVINLPISADTSSQDELYGVLAPSPRKLFPEGPSTDRVRVSNHGKALGTSTSGVYYLERNTSSINNFLLSNITSDYTTGWMPGDIKGAFLSDTDDTDLVGSGNLDPGFSSYNIIGTGTWADNGDGSYTFTDTVGGQDRPGVEMPVSLATDGSKEYVLQYTIVSLNQQMRVSYFAGGPSQFPGSPGTRTFYGYPRSTGTIRFQIESSPSTIGQTFTIRDVSLYEVDRDRSVNAKGLVVNGTVTRSPVASGADLVAYSGLSQTNALIARNNPGLDLGTDPWVMMGWLKWNGGDSFFNFLGCSSPSFKLELRSIENTFDLAFGGVTSYKFGSNPPANKWIHWALVYEGVSTQAKWYIDGALNDTLSSSIFGSDIDFSNSDFYVGSHPTRGGSSGALIHSLIRISATAPTAGQIQKIYNDEKYLFEPNAKATLYGSSDAVTALAYDSDTELLHVGTSAGRSVFRGLERVSYRPTSASTAISAGGGLIASK